MRVSRLTRFAPLLVVAALTAACSSAEAPGWTYAPAPSATAAPSGSAAASGEPSAAPSEAPSEAPSSEPSGEPSGEPSTEPSGAAGTTLEMVASGVAYETLELTAPAGQPFSIHFVNNDPPGLPHDIDIETDSGEVLQDHPTIDGGQETTYDFEPLEAGEYVFQCSVHPIPAMTGKLTVE